MPLELLTLILKDQLFSELHRRNSERGIKAALRAVCGEYCENITTQRFQYQMKCSGKE